MLLLCVLAAIPHGHQTLGAFVVENECPPALLLSIWQMRTMLPELQVQILHTAKNAKWLRRIYTDDPNVRLTLLPEPYATGGFDRDIYSTALTDVKLWQRIAFSRALQFQKDTWLCGTGRVSMLPRLRRYSAYDLVASPWDWPENLRVSSWASSKPLSTWLRKFDACRGVGNGGFRLLNISAMRHVASIHGPINTSRIHGKLVEEYPEDIFFCQHLSTTRGYKVAKLSVARSFGVEALKPIGKPIGTHRPWTHPQVWSERFRAACPGLQLLRLGAAATSSCTSHALGLELVRWASTRYNNTRHMASLDGLQEACAREEASGCSPELKTLVDMCSGLINCLLKATGFLHADGRWV